NAVEQPTVHVAGYSAVDLVVGGHDAPHFGFLHRRLIRHQISLPQLPLGAVLGSAIASAGGSAVAREMLERGQDVVSVDHEVVALEPARRRHSHAGSEIRVLAE